MYLSAITICMLNSDASRLYPLLKSSGFTRGGVDDKYVFNTMYESKRKSGVILTSLGGRPRAMDYREVIKIVKENGMKNASDILSISLAAMQGRYYNAVAALKKENAPVTE